MKPIAYLMVERNNQTSHFQTTIPTREEKISHHAIPLYTKEEDIKLLIMKAQDISPEDRLRTHEEQQEWLRNVRKTGY
jgi:hypothetical protein